MKTEQRNDWNAPYWSNEKHGNAWDRVKEAFKREMAGLLGRSVSKGSPGRPPRGDPSNAMHPDLFRPSGKNVV